MLTHTTFEKRWASLIKEKNPNMDELNTLLKAHKESCKYSDDYCLSKIYCPQCIHRWSGDKE